jgi:hypothetical protein
MLGNNPILTTLMRVVALSEDKINTYDVTYRIDKPYLEDYLPTVEKNHRFNSNNKLIISL